MTTSNADQMAHEEILERRRQEEREQERRVEDNAAWFAAIAERTFVENGKWIASPTEGLARFVGVSGDVWDYDESTDTALPVMCGQCERPLKYPEPDMPEICGGCRDEVIEFHMNDRRDPIPFDPT